MNEAIVQLINNIHPLTEEAWKDFAAAFQEKEVPRKTILTSAGETERYLYVITSGVQRMYHIHDDGKEATVLFTYAPSFGGVIDSLLQQSVSIFHYETLTPTRLWYLHVNQLEVLMQQHPSIETLVRKGVTNALSGVMERLVNLQSMQAEERFLVLLKRSPHLLQLIPHKYIASYLGMDPTNFSKLMNKVKL